MIWPWVPRAVYDEAIRKTDRAIDQTDAALELAGRQRILYDVLLEKYHALKLAGAVPEAKLPEVVPVPVRQEDEAKMLISEISGTDYRKRSMMLKQLAFDRASGVNEERIKREIVSGVQSDGVAA